MKTTFQKTITSHSKTELDDTVNKFKETEGINAIASQQNVFVVKDIPYFVATIFYKKE